MRSVTTRGLASGGVRRGGGSPGFLTPLFGRLKVGDTAPKSLDLAPERRGGSYGPRIEATSNSGAAAKGQKPWVAAAGRLCREAAEASQRGLAAIVAGGATGSTARGGHCSPTLPLPGRELSRPAPRVERWTSGRLGIDHAPPARDDGAHALSLDRAIPRAGALTLADVDSRFLWIACEACGWRGRYCVARLRSIHGDKPARASRQATRSTARPASADRGQARYLTGVET
jgi:hypothetical protein